MSIWFISENPERDGLNWYAYCSNNPVNYVDPTGLMAAEATAATVSVEVYVLVGGVLTITAWNLLHGHNPVPAIKDFARDIWDFNKRAINKIKQTADDIKENILQAEVTETAGDGAGQAESEVDWENPPADPSQLPEEWEDNTDDRKRQNTEDRDYRNNETGEEVEFHPKNSNGEDRPHWHRHNPDATGRHDKYLDREGTPVRKGSPESHIYPNEGAN